MTYLCTLGCRRKTLPGFTLCAECWAKVRERPKPAEGVVDLMGDLEESLGLPRGGGEDQP